MLRKCYILIGDLQCTIHVDWLKESDITFRCTCDSIRGGGERETLNAKTFFWKQKSHIIKPVWWGGGGNIEGDSHPLQGKKKFENWGIMNSCFHKTRLRIPFWFYFVLTLFAWKTWKKKKRNYFLMTHYECVC